MKLKKLFLLLVAFVLFLPTLLKAQDNTEATTCNDDLITIESVTLEQKGDNVVELNQPVVNGKSIKFDVKMNTVGDGIQYKIIINNASTEDYEFGNLNTSTNYISYTYTSDSNGTIVKAGTTKTIYLAIQYEHEVPSTAFTGGTFYDDKDLEINLSTDITGTGANNNTNNNTNNTANDKVTNPKTGTEATLLFIIVTLFVAGICYIVFNKAKNIKHLVIVLGLLLVLPLTVYATCSCKIEIESKITIEYVDTTTPETGGGLDIIKSGVVTSGQGVYNDTITNRYVFKGENPNNYIQLDDDLYRIIAIEPDDSLKLIKATSIGTIPFDVGYADYVEGVTEANSLTGVRHGIGAGSDDYCYNTTSDRYVGCKVWGSSSSTFQIISGEYEQVINFPKGPYLKNLPAQEAYLNTYLNDLNTGWRSTLGTTASEFIKTKYFNIGTIDVDSNNESDHLWPGYVGLMNTSDYVKASSNTECTGVNTYTNNSSCFNNSNEHNYLFINGTHEWTLNPTAQANNSKVWSINTNGQLDPTSDANSSYNVRPVFYIELRESSLSGNGTMANPYKTNVIK